MVEIDKLVKDINKKFGTNAIRLGRNIREDMNFKIPLGSVGLNDALGGGLPSGRYITLAGQESSGKSLLAYKAIAAVQNLRKKLVGEGADAYEVVADDGDTPLTAALIQLECGSYSPDWGEVHGIDNDRLIFVQPEGMEQALDLACALQRAGVEFIVIDSIAAMLPTKEIETDQEDTVQMGLRAKALNVFHGKFQSINNSLERNGKLPTTLLAINQLREKIGAYGNPLYCLHGETNVVFVDGRTIPIEKVVKEHIQGEVWGFDESTGLFKPCKILNWFDNGKLDVQNDSFYTITTNGVGSKNGRFSITTTSDHKILTDSGWKYAKDISLADKLVTKMPEVVNGTLKDFLYGTLVGDCSLNYGHKPSNTANLNFQDSQNVEYLNWKVSKLSKAFNMHLDAARGAWRSNYTTELASIKKALGNRDVKVFIKNFSYLGLAVYFMDDGNTDLGRGRACIAMRRFTKDFETLEFVADFFKSIGMDCTPLKTGYILFTATGSDTLFKRISKYVPQCMQYKLPLKYRGLYEDFKLDFTLRTVPQYVDVLDAGISKSRKFRNKHLYDLEVDTAHNFLAGGTGSGLVVHNCPGGSSQKFTNAIEIRTRVGDIIREGTGVNARTVGRIIKWKIEKNKTGKAFSDGEYDLYVDDALLPRGSIDTGKELVILAMSKGLIERRGGWFYYNGEQLGQGQDNVVAKLRENQELFMEIVEKL